MGTHTLSTETGLKTKARALVPALRVLLLAPYGSGDLTFSMSHYTRLLERELGKRGIVSEIIRPERRLGQFRRGPVILQKVLSAIDKLVIFPRQLRRRLRELQNEGSPFLVHITDQAYANYTRYLRDVPHVITCHDILAIRVTLEGSPYTELQLRTRLYQRFLLRGLRKARHVITISDATRDDLIRIAGLPEKRITTVGLSANSAFSPVPLDEAQSRLERLLGGNTGRPYFMHVGANSWYKNRIGALRIFKSLRDLAPSRDFRFVMVGHPATDEMRDYIVGHELTPYVTTLHNIDSADLQALYSWAEGLIFPSYHEGFGWPLLEAQLCGCPVITSDRPPMNEVTGKGALYINPDEPEEAARTIARNLDGLPALRRKGLDNASRFTVENMMRHYVEIYGILTSDTSHT